MLKQDDTSNYVFATRLPKEKKNYWINERWIRGKNTNNENDEYKKWTKDIKSVIKLKIKFQDYKNSLKATNFTKVNIQNKLPRKKQNFV